MEISEQMVFLNLAVTQWWVASLNPPHLKAMIPWEGLNDMYREVAFHGGIPRYWLLSFLDTRYFCEMDR